MRGRGLGRGHYSDKGAGYSLEQPVVWGTEGLASISTVKEEKKGACVCEECGMGGGGGLIVPDQPEHELV